MGRPRAEYPWRRIDPSLLLACMAFSEAERDRLLERISTRYGMHRTTLSRRLQFLQARFISPNAGEVALEQYQRQMLRSIRFHRLYAKVRLALMTKVERVRERQAARLQTALPISEAAKTLKVRAETLRRWIEDLGVIELDADGQVPKSELWRFVRSDEWRWLLPALRLRRTMLKSETQKFNAPIDLQTMTSTEAT
jgi:hypothetical protein